MTTAFQGNQLSQHCRGTLDASELLRDLAAAANLPLHGALFSQQLLGLTHRGGQKGQVLTLTSTISFPLQPQSTSTSSCILREVQDWPHSSFQTLCCQLVP